MSLKKSNIESWKNRLYLFGGFGRDNLIYVLVTLSSSKFRIKVLHEFNNVVIAFITRIVVGIEERAGK